MTKLKINELYKSSELEFQTCRYLKLQKTFVSQFGKSNITYFSSPGRTEICGNHTDHNNGKVVAASINLDAIAAAQINNSNNVVLYSEGFNEAFKVDLTDLSIQPNEKETTNSLIRGLAAGLEKNGYKIGGFNASITSNVLQGSGLSSSASIEVLIGYIFNVFFNDGRISPIEIAEISQFAENEYFGKPCGLMDQMACSVGNIITIDFKETKNAIVTPLDFDFSKVDYSLAVIDTGGNHADLTEDYASIPTEMKEIALYFGKDNCRQINRNEFFQFISKIEKHSKPPSNFKSITLYERKQTC